MTRVAPKAGARTNPPTGERVWLSGADRISSLEVPEAQRFTNCFCATCGGRVPRQPAGTDIVMIPAGSLDAEPPIAPQARIFTDSRAAWSCADDALPTFPEAPR